MIDTTTPSPTRPALSRTSTALKVAAVLAVLPVGGGWLAWRSTALAAVPGIAAGPSEPAPLPVKSSKPTIKAPQPEVVQPALDAYNAGRYPEAEAAAEPLVAQAARSPDPAVRKQGARARWVQAFSAARRRDLSLARERFALLKREAARLPDKGKPEVKLGETPPPTLEEEGAYQHAVLTAALGQEEAAEGEFKRFMRDYPESPLAHAAVKRIGRMHDGDIPKDAEVVWQAAVKTAQTRANARERSRSLCGPEVLAEVLRRRAERAGGGSAAVAPGVGELARELNTDHLGTTLQAVAEAARKRGFTAKGLQLTWKGLQAQFNAPAPAAAPAPYMLALIQPGHYVLVEQASFSQVRVWDPQAVPPSGAPGDAGRPGTREFTPEQWAAVWQGVVLTLR